MISDFSWLASEAHKIHGIFEGLFYSLTLTLMLIAITLEYFKFPLGMAPSFGQIVGRAFIASIMLVSFPEVLDLTAIFCDSLANKIGDLNNFQLVLSRMSEQLDRLTWSWTSVKQMVIVVISFVSFFLLYISVFFTDALYLYSWTALYIFSPLLILFYIIPSTASATKTLYRSLFMVASWKIVWSTMATLLWSAALMNLDKLGEKTTFLTIIIFNLMLAASLLLTPLLVSAMFSGGVEGQSSKAGAMALGGATLMFGKISALRGFKDLAGKMKDGAQSKGQDYIRRRSLERIHRRAEKFSSTKTNASKPKGGMR